MIHEAHSPWLLASPLALLIACSSSERDASEGAGPTFPAGNEPPLTGSLEPASATPSESRKRQ
jgi:hypothetical protein